ncbi:radical SAM protein [Candidatus Falkowbacteria bacterium]|nr:radical SAM protein [Candidatus Falkowbacteria bacterium]
MATDIAWIRNADVRKRTVAGEILLLAIKKNRLLILDEQAVAIWDILSSSEPCREKNIVGTLQREYPNATIEQLSTDVHNFLCDIGHKGFAHHDGEVTPEAEGSDNKQSICSGHFPFSEKLHQHATQLNIPVSGGLELTQRCHLKCIHCYIDNQPISCSNELSTTEIFMLLDQMAEYGCLWLLITGGEPLLRRDFTDIYRHAKELGMIVTVFMSATNITRRVADIFTEYPPFLVEATLHGSTKTTFEAITGVHGSFRQFKHGIELLNERGISFHLKMIVMRENLHEVEPARQLAIKLGAKDFRFDSMVNADFLHTVKSTDLRITIKEAMELDILEPYRERWKRMFRAALGEQARRPVSRDLLFPCRAGKSSFTVSANGNLLPCILMRVPAYNLRTMSFSQAWNRLNHYTTTARMREDNLCRTCPVQTCSRCPAWGYLEHEDPDVKSRFACGLQQEREAYFLSTNRQKEATS